MTVAVVILRKRGISHQLFSWEGLVLPYYVYVLLCDDGSYYTGYAKDVDSRVKQHMNGVGARYTKVHRPRRLVHTEEFHTIREAMSRERAIKRLRHDEKRKLVSAPL